MRVVGRPKKKRIIKSIPKILQFSPRGKPGRPDEVELELEQIEAVRLVDHLGLKQEEAAQQMGLSRQTLGRILQRARKKIADAIISGKIIKISNSPIKLAKK